MSQEPSERERGAAVGPSAPVSGGRPAAPTRGPSMGMVLLGLVLILVGAGWLLDIAGVVTVSLTLMLTLALILVGLSLIVLSGRGDHGGLVTLGVLLVLTLTLVSLVRIPLDGEIGDRAYRPGTLAEVQDRYAVLVGSQEIDLRGVEFPPGETSIEAEFTVGDLVIRLPEGVAVRVRWSLGAGDVEVLRREQSGFGLRDEHQDDDYDAAERRLLIEISGGAGSVVVRR